MTERAVESSCVLKFKSQNPNNSFNTVCVTCQMGKIKASKGKGEFDGRNKENPRIDEKKIEKEVINRENLVRQ